MSLGFDDPCRHSGLGRDFNRQKRNGLRQSSQAVSLVREKVPVVIASGRESADVLRFARELGLSSPQISDGGSIILDPGSGRFLWTAPLPSGPAQEIVKSLDASGTPFIATHPEGSVYGLVAVAHRQIIRVSALDLDESGANRLLEQFQSSPDLNTVKVSCHTTAFGLWTSPVPAWTKLPRS